MTLRRSLAIGLPVGRRTTEANDTFVTRDGPALNDIVVNRQSHDHTHPEPNAKPGPTCCHMKWPNWPLPNE